MERKHSKVLTQTKIYNEKVELQKLNCTFRFNRKLKIISFHF